MSDHEAPHLTNGVGHKIEDDDEEVLPFVEDDYGGVIVEMKNLMDSKCFVTRLRYSLAQWRLQGKKGIWLNLPLSNVNLVEPAVKEGFRYHHAEPTYLMLVYWIPEAVSTIPLNASHRVRVGAVVLNHNKELLVVQEKYGTLKGSGVWKIPTGVVDEGEDIFAAAIREVKEETGIDTEFLYIYIIKSSSSFPQIEMASIVNQYLVNHPIISNFKWTENETLGSTISFVTVTLSIYLSSTFLLRFFINSIPSLSPQILKPITAVHSFILFLLSLIMAVGCTLSILSSSDPTVSICFPLHTKPNGSLFFWAQVFYLSKILEFGDTILIILGKSIQRLSFLHVYHHATVVVMCYLWLRTRQSMFPIALVTNSTVHVIMYGYYFLCALGSRPKWKRLVTDCQIVQFVFSFCLSGWMLKEHFWGSGCSGIWGWCFNAAFNASLLALFFNFHTKNYVKKTKTGSEVGNKSD